MYSDFVRVPSPNGWGQFLWQPSLPQKVYTEVYFLETMEKSVHYGSPKIVEVRDAYFWSSDLSEYIAFTLQLPREQKYRLSTNYPDTAHLSAR